MSKFGPEPLAAAVLISIFYSVATFAGTPTEDYCSHLLTRLNRELLSQKAPTAKNFQRLHEASNAEKTEVGKALFPSLVRPDVGKPIAYSDETITTTRRDYASYLAILEKELASAPATEVKSLQRRISALKTFMAVPDQYIFGHTVELTTPKGKQNINFYVLDVKNYLEFQQLNMSNQARMRFLSGERLTPTEQLGSQSQEPVTHAMQGLDFTYAQYLDRRGVPADVIEGMKQADRRPESREIFIVASTDGNTFGTLRAGFSDNPGIKLPLEKKNSIQLPRREGEVLVELGRFAIHREGGTAVWEQVIRDALYAIRKTTASASGPIRIYLDADRIGARLYSQKYGCQVVKEPKDFGGKDEFVLTATLEELEQRFGIK